MINHAEDDWVSVDEKLELPQELLDSVFTEMPPENVVASANPSAVGMKRILTGIVLSCINLNFLALNHILSTIGAILLLLGFRSFRRENSWFQVAYICAVVRIILITPQLILNATIYSAYLQGEAGQIALIGTCTVQILMLFCFWMGLGKLQKKAGILEKTSGAAALFIWYTLLLVLAVTGLAGTVAAIVMIAVFILIIRSLTVLSKQIASSGYVLKAAPIRIGDTILVQSYVGLLVAGIVCGYLFFADYPMNWEAADFSTGSAEEVYDRLLALGYPEKQLQDLSAEELVLLKQASCVVTETDERPLNSGNEKTEYYDGTTYITTEYPEKELTITHVAVRIAGDGTKGERWRVIHHFALDDSLKVKGTANIDLWPLESMGGWNGTENLSGRLLCRENGEDFTAEYFSIGQRTYTTTDFFGATRQTTDCMCDFSLPSHATDRRGYVAYTSEQIENGYLLNAWINYTHQVGSVQYPVRTAGEYVQEGMHIRDYPFRTAQAALQFYISDGVPDLESLKEFENADVNY